MSCSMLLRTADFIGRDRTIPTCRLRKPLESSGSNLLMHLYLSDRFLFLMLPHKRKSLIVNIKSRMCLSLMTALYSG